MSSAIKIRLFNPQNAVTGFIAFNLVTYVLFRVSADLIGIEKIAVSGWLTLAMLLFAAKQIINFYFVYIAKSWPIRTALIAFIGCETSVMIIFGMFSLFNPYLWVLLFKQWLSLL